MANKRMFTMKIVDSDAFLDMPLSSQCLYFHLNMRADDDGFVGNPKKIVRLINANEDDLKLLIAKRFVLTFENGVIVIKHWRMHNTLSQNRYNETTYLDEKSMLLLKENGSYSFTDGVPLNDQRLIEMSGRQSRRTKDVQKTYSDIDKDIDIELDISNNKEISKNIENNNKDIYIAPSNLENCSMPAVISLELNDNSLYPIYQKDIDEWSELYQAVDVMQELRKMKGWLSANPKKRKTKNGVKRFINAWLSREQDKPHIKEEKKDALKITAFDV